MQTIFETILIQIASSSFAFETIVVYSSKIARIAIAIKIAYSAIAIRIARTIVAKKFEKCLDRKHKDNF